MTKNVEYTILATSVGPYDGTTLPPPSMKKALFEVRNVESLQVEGDEKKKININIVESYDNGKIQVTQPNKRRKTTTERQVVCSPNYFKFNQRYVKQNL